MKKNTILLFFVLTSLSLTAQNKETKSADILVESYDYVKAVQEYLNLVAKGNTDPYVSKQLGDCYYYMFNTIESEKWYAKATQSQQDAETYFRYAQMLKSNGKYAESNIQMALFADRMPNDQRAIVFIKDPNYLTKLNALENRFEVNAIPVNSERSDFGAILYGDVLYFASARNESNKTYGWNNEPYLDIFQSTYTADGKYSEPIAVNELNSRFHEGPVTMNKEGSVVYFSSESFKDKLFDKDKTRKIKFGQVNLYKATKENGKWSNITALPFNSKSYSAGNPSLDKDGKILYFASNMPGSVGGTDIWKVKVNSDGSFGIPENLGTKINTVGDENFPFMGDDSILYFSSNGLTGFGSLDVFSVDLNTDGEPHNMGKPINTEKDDFAFSFNKDKNIGYVSSNRFGKDHIYSAIPICKAQIFIVVKNAKTGALLANSRVVILDNATTILDTQLSSNDGEVLYDLSCLKSYTIQVFKNGYVTKSFPASSKQGLITMEVALEPIDVVVTETEILLNPIYFYSNKSDITERGAVELDKLVYVLAQNSNLQIDVRSHTDSRGSDSYNLDLSERRAQSTVAYIISKGISSERISGKGFGESIPKIDCQNNCTELEFALNRRSEFMIRK
ncbi:outer membrane protein OmpA-like peptidoglycan-associated protein/tetratricopeptide (TPR) repeat protein [Flavobacterium sp. CG_9.1]|uniref:OmpA family protein n=1 Tax=Flavobacterium sp. CG_9.1 TaxID=2787728 RepID=UPI0018CA8E78|nr:OmpA family protein [Flavobacterium sp. CG_9.1]MBG6063535.1 outer membrane protein OmpA-like peptidoglycan-associated protein/tetratricopeptide (TPR) repeat protein [Flavobacterium sp. CG_9.1]